MTRSDLDDRDDDRQWSQSEKEQILNDARATLARRNDQEIPRRDGNQETWSEDEKAEILASARANIRRDASGLVTKVTTQDAFEAEAPEPRQPRQRYRRRRRSEASAGPIEGTAWPAPREGNLDISLEGLIGARVETLFAEQHEYISELVAQALAYSVDKDGVVESAIADAVEKERRQHRRDVRELKARIGTLERSLDELRNAVAVERNRTLALPALPARRDFN
jgi:hypothetical protein